MEAMTLLVGAVIVYDRESDQVVLLQRGPRAKFAQGMWDLPVGKARSGEPITATAVRELREETGLTVQPDALHVAHVIHAARGVEAPNGFLTVVFVAHAWTGRLCNPEPFHHSTVAWTPVTAIPENFVPTTRQALISYLTHGRELSLHGWA
jgi:8-oxo-dGTP pyrophosphatase MutT (NUDIX family)